MKEKIQDQLITCHLVMLDGTYGMHVQLNTLLEHLPSPFATWDLVFVVSDKDIEEKNPIKSLKRQKLYMPNGYMHIKQVI